MREEARGETHIEGQTLRPYASIRIGREKCSQKRGNRECKLYR